MQPLVETDGQLHNIAVYYLGVMCLDLHYFIAANQIFQV